MIKDYGFIPPVITDTHYIEGDGRLLGASVVNPLGDWEKYLPQYEAQADKYETYACTCFGATNQLETHIKYLYGNDSNYSERYLYNLVGINPPGADPQNVYEAVRRFGVVNQEMLPMPDTLDEFRKPRPMTDFFKIDGASWKNEFFFDHDWVLTGTPNPEKLRIELKKCPIGVSVTAWFLKDGVYVDEGQSNTHWCLLYKMDNDFYYVFDSYDHSKKTLPIGQHKINYAKRIVLYKTDPSVINRSFLEILKGMVKLLQDFYEYTKKTAGVVGGIILDTFKKETEMKYTPLEELDIELLKKQLEPTMEEKLLKVTLDALDTDVTPKDETPDGVACAEVVSTLIGKVLPDFKKTSSTVELDMKLFLDKRFARVTIPERGNIVVSPRKGDVFGHCGIFITNERVASNNSFGVNKGKLTGNYSWSDWIEEFKDRRGLKIYLYKLT